MIIKNKNRTRNFRKNTSLKNGFKRMNIKGDFNGPPCNSLSLFSITDENILSFRRYLNSPMDCFINALQVFGALDEKCSNIMRISAAGKTGFSREEMEKIFTFLTNNNFEFKLINDFNEFENELISKITNNHGAFVGYSSPGVSYKFVVAEMPSVGHVFIIAKNSDGVLILIDPQINYLGPYENVRNLIYSLNRNYHILFNSLEKFTPQQMRSLGFIY